MATRSFAPSPGARFPDVRLLRCFVTAAEEGSLRRAAERLFLTQPPLSRQIRELEDRLGLPLFVRHSRGLTLTPEGAEVLRIVRPLLDCGEKTFVRLEHLARTSRTAQRTLRVGFSTAFEQGVYRPVEDCLRVAHGDRLRVARASSPALARSVAKGKLDAACVALPLAEADAPYLRTVPLSYSELLLAVLPAVWPEAARSSLSLAGLSGRPLFWFRRECNPAFFDFTRGVFAHAGFSPVLVEEPEEHDVLLARIAGGEGMGLLPASFAAIRREGVVFAAHEERGLRIRMGIVTASRMADGENVSDDAAPPDGVETLMAGAFESMGEERFSDR